MNELTFGLIMFIGLMKWIALAQWQVQYKNVCKVAFISPGEEIDHEENVNVSQVSPPTEDICC